MYDITLILSLLAVIAAIVALANRLQIPYPILLVVVGLVIGLIIGPIPSLPTVRLEPDLVLLLFLPPLLYWEAVTTSWRDFRANLRPITSLAVGLVVFTTCGVALIAHLVIGLSWTVAFVLGAVVSSTDAVSAIAVTERLGVPQRVITILAGEGLVNDATALVVYGAAVTAVVHGAFSPAEAGLRFVGASVGGVAIGLTVGWVLARLRRSISDTRVEGTVSLLTPFAAYLPADLVGGSGVLAAVAAGLYLGRQSPVVVSPALRLRADAVWELGTFLLNGLVFILIGLEFHSILLDLSTRSIATLLGDVAVVSGAVIVVRLAWVFSAGGSIQLLRRRSQTKAPPLSPAALGIIGWAGMRGVISLATALALPERTDRGPLADRDLLLFITFGVILVTLVGQGLSLAPIIRWLGVSMDDTEQGEEMRARLAAARAALGQLEVLAAQDRTQRAAIDDLRQHYRRRIEKLESRAAAADELQPSFGDMRHELLNVERQTLIDLRNQGVISDDVLRRIQRELDLEQVRLDAEPR